MKKIIIIYNKIKRGFAIYCQPLSDWEDAISNEGERLVPKLASDPEVIRHKSSYMFFRKIIENDLSVLKHKKINIIDLGCGVGHGCLLLSKLKNVKVTGVDNSLEAIKYAQKHYSAANITYRQADLAKFISKMSKYDYVVSRGVFEHISGGLALAQKSAWRYRLIFDVPYDESKDSNPFHLITKITEKNFKKYKNITLFYEDLNGIIYDQETKSDSPNMIVCVASSSEIKKSKFNQKDLKFPYPAWKEKIK